MRSETYLNCALRETQEETGLDLSESIPVAYHKLSVGEYFFFELEEEVAIDIQDTAEVVEARWVSLQDIADLPCNVDVNNFLSRLSRSFRRP
jgi:8-oxo-dGTP pyrophosphatase MutT (NUDIX family)